MAKTHVTHNPQESVMTGTPGAGATPENTPVPGGGRWRWDITKPGWVEVIEATEATPPAPQPTPYQE